MKKKLLIAIATIFVFLVLTSSLAICVAGTSLEYVLSQRMSVRNWSDAPVEEEIINSICKNSFASAFDLEGMELYISNSTGTYQYDKEYNQFVLKISGDLRHQLGVDIGQTFVANAPYIMTIVCNDEIEPSSLDANRKGGIIAQNLQILAIRHNLGGVCVGDGIYDNEVMTNMQYHLGLGENREVIALFPIGYLTTGQTYPTNNLEATTGNMPTPFEANMDMLELFQDPHEQSLTWQNIGVSQQKLSNMLWATYGYSLLGTEHRTIPSAYGEYPFQIYVCDETGVYNYTAESHSLHQTSSLDKRSDIIMHANAPKYLEEAPMLLIFCWNSQVGTNNASDSDSGGRFINVEYGCCLQNLYLSANLWGIGVSSPIYMSNYGALRIDLSELSLSNVYPMYLIGLGEPIADEGPLVIGSSFQTPADQVLPDQEVKVSVNVTGVQDNVENVTLSYTVDDGTSWINILMNYNTSMSVYEAIIPEQPAGTQVKYEIIAFDKENNIVTENNSGHFFSYIVVIPEFTEIMLLLTLCFSSIFILVLRKKLNK